MNRQYITLFLSFLVIFFIPSCQVPDQISEEPEGHVLVEVPPLTDAIPFELLGQGKILFERIGPYPGNYKGFYIIDIDNKKTWGFYLQERSLTPVISPNGQKIAFVMDTSLPAITVDDIYVMKIDGTDIRNVSKMNGLEEWPSWIPNGTRILFWENITLYSQSSVVPEAKYIVKELPFFPSGSASASVDGKIVFCASGLSQIPPGICIMDMDGKNLKSFLRIPKDRNLGSPVFSPDGQKIAYVSVSRDSERAFEAVEIVVVDRKGSNPQLLASIKAGGSRHWNNHYILRPYSITLCWSPDGSKLLFTIPEKDYVSHIYLIKSDGTGLTQITTAEGVTDRNVSWGR